jgi:hypothetical protein
MAQRLSPRRSFYLDQRARIQQKTDASLFENQSMFINYYNEAFPEMQ